MPTPQPRYVNTLDVTLVTDLFLGDEWNPARKLSFFQLSQKVVMLRLLLTFQRGEIILALELTDIEISRSKVEIVNRNQRLKQGRPRYKPKKTVSKSHQWTNNIKTPNTFKTEEWLTHTIDSFLKRLDAIEAQKSIQNKPSTSSASQLCEITFPAHAFEHTNESRKLNSTSAMPSKVQHDNLLLKVMKMKWN